VGSGYFGDAHLTIFNDSRDKRTVKMTLEGRVPPASRELLSGVSIQWKDKTTELTLDGDDVAVIQLKYKNKQ
jgi:hypothetical protein